MDAAKPAYFWRGIIESREHATKVLMSGTMGFMIFGGLGCAAAFTPPFDFYKLIGPLLFVFLPAYILRRTQSVAAAWVLFGISAFALIISVVAAGSIVRSSTGYFAAIAFAVMLLFWLAVLVAASRVLRAAKFLRAISSDRPTPAKS